MTIQKAIKNYEQIIVPVNLDRHWLTVILDVVNTKVIFMDSLPEKINDRSMKRPGPVHGSRVGKILKASGVFESYTAAKNALGVQGQTFTWPRMDFQRS